MQERENVRMQEVGRASFEKQGFNWESDPKAQGNAPESRHVRGTLIVRGLLERGTFGGEGLN